MRRIKPYLASAPAKADNAQLGRISLSGAPGPRHGGVEVRPNLAFGHPCDNLHDLLDVAETSDVALASVKRRGNCEIAGLGEASANIFDVFMHAENFVHDEYSGE